MEIKKENTFPSKLKNEKDILVQKKHFKNVNEKENILGSATTNQIDQHLFFTKIVLEEATSRTLSQSEITIFLETQQYVQLLKDRKKSDDEILDMLFELYVKGAIFLGTCKEHNTDNVGIYYANKGIYSFFKVFIYDVFNREKIDYE